MDLLASLMGFLDVLIGVVAPFLLVLGLVVFVHEYGHYIVGRWCGIHAEAFSVGFGREIVGWTDKRGTRWRIAWLPLGGYVRFKGDADAASATNEAQGEGMSPEERRETLFGAPLWARAATVAAGPMANFLFTMVVVAGLVLVAGRASDAPRIGDVTASGQALGVGLQGGDRVLSIDGAPVTSLTGFVNDLLETPGVSRLVEVERDDAIVTLPISFTQSTRVTAIAAGGAAQRACIAPGDVIQAVDGEPIASFDQLQSAVVNSEGRELQLTIERPGEGLIMIALTPERREFVDPQTREVEQRLMIGISAERNIGIVAQRESVGLLGAAQAGVAAPFAMAGATLGYVWSWIAGDADGSSVGSFIGIARLSGDAAGAGVIEFIGFIATISTAIGLINLFPIPILDGGHLVFYALEAVRGRPLGERATNLATLVGLAAIMALMIFAVSNDLAGALGGLQADC